MTKTSEKQTKTLKARPPVVVVLGHIDHGKTTLLDQIRKSKVVEKESGGITQHIAAYEIEDKGKKITFIDTPGHEAFFDMRSRGAKVADIAILVVASDDGVKTQTKEAIEHIKSSKIPMIVAINKMDKQIADPEKVKRELTQQKILVESMSGKVPCVELSAKTGKGIPELLEIILLVAEMENLSTDPSKPAQGVVIEAHLDPLRGQTAILLLTDGILKKNDIIGTISTSGKIKILENFQGKSINQAKPSMPIIALGLEGLPQTGEEFKVFDTIENAKTFVQKTKQGPKTSTVSSEKQVVNFILKADVAGSLEAVKEMLNKLTQEGVSLKIIKAEVGEVNESDVKLALGFKARILAFHVKTDPVAQQFFQREKISIKRFDVIYELIDYVKERMQKAVRKERVRTDLGKMKTLVIFRTEKKQQIVGGKMIEGEVKKGLKIEVVREEEVVGKGKLVGLQKNKKTIEKAKKRDEIGILFQGDIKIEEDDILLFYEYSMR